MNTFMWESPFTEEHLSRLRALGASVVPPVGKRLACGDVGLGAMAAPEDVAAAALAALRARYAGGGPGGEDLELPDGLAAAAGGAAGAAAAGSAAAGGGS
jgi:hypothetical protein